MLFYESNRSGSETLLPSVCFFTNNEAQLCFVLQESALNAISATTGNADCVSDIAATG